MSWIHTKSFEMCLAQVKWHAHVSLVVSLWWSSDLNSACYFYQNSISQNFFLTAWPVNLQWLQNWPLPNAALFTSSHHYSPSHLYSRSVFPKYLSCLPDLTLTDIPTSNTLTYELGEKTWHLWKLRIFSKKICFPITLNISVLNYSPSPTISLAFSVGDLWAAVNEYWLLKSSWNKYSTPGFRAGVGWG